MYAGKFIVVEGADGTGKTTIVAELSAWLNKCGLLNVITRHPGSTPIGAALRKISNESKESEIAIPPITEGLIMAADNSAFIELILKPSLKVGTWVISDRNNYISGLAYQIASGASWEQLDKIQAATATPDQPKIDVLFILTADEETRRSRLALRSDGKTDRFESRGAAYMNTVVRAYERLMEEQTERLVKYVATSKTAPEPTPLVFYIDAGKPVGNVLESMKDIVRSLLFAPVI